MNNLYILLSKYNYNNVILKNSQYKVEYKKYYYDVIIIRL